VLCKLNHFGWMSGTDNKVWHGKNFNHWKFSDFVLDP